MSAPPLHFNSSAKLMSNMCNQVISSVLAGLDVYDKNSVLCRWPKYASRVIFELYQSTHRTPNLDTTTSSSHVFRLLFNGLDVTSLVPACGSRLIHISNTKPSDPEMRLCPLSALREQVEDMIGPYKSFDDACTVK